MQDALAGPLGRLNGRVTLWLARIGAVVLAILALLTFSDVFMRYVFNRPFNFTVEIAELGMGIIVFFGVGYVTHLKEHVSVDFVVIRLPERIRSIVDFFIQIIAFVYLVVLCWRLWQKAFNLVDTGDFTSVLYIPLWPVAFLMSIASLLLLTGTLLHIANAFARIFAKSDAD